MRKAVFITGTSQGLGLALAKLYLAKNWAVLGCSRQKVDLGEGYQHVSLDLADLSAVSSQLVPEMKEFFKKAEVGVFINNAALLAPCRMMDLDLHDLQMQYLVNTVVPLWLVKCFVSLAVSKKTVTQISSGAAHKPYAGWSGYCGSKAGMALSMEVASGEAEGARVTFIDYNPGAMDTLMQEQVRQTSVNVFPAKKKFDDLHSAGRLGDVKEVSYDIFACVAAGIPGFWKKNFPRKYRN